MIAKAFKYRIYPSREQISKIERHFGCSRFVYNDALADRIKAFSDTGKGITCFDTIKKLPKLKKSPETQWLSEVNSQSLQASLRNLDTAYRNFFRKTGRFPRFKNKRDGHQSFQCPQQGRVDFTSNTISVPKIFKIKAVLHRKFKGKVKTVTISRTPALKYFASVSVETDENILPRKAIKPSTTIGVDLGIKTLAVCSNGLVFGNPKFLRKEMMRLKVLQKRLSKKVKGSSNRRKAILKVAKLHERISDKRKDTLDRITNRLTTDAEIQSICVENLNVKGMSANHCLAQAINDASFGEFLRQLEYKCEWRGINLIKIGRFLPSSKTCSVCGIVKDTLSLEEREFKCEACGFNEDRDINASKNIRSFGLSGRVSPVEPVEALAIAKPLKQEIHAIRRR